MEIGPVGPATQKELAPAQAHNKFMYGRDGTCSDKLDDMSFYHILLLLAIIMSYAVDTSVCERGFAPHEQPQDVTALAHGQLAAADAHDHLRARQGVGRPNQDPHQQEIVTEWREQSSKGRYEAAMWRAAGLEEPNAEGAKGGADAGATTEVDNLTAGGFFGWMGREQLGAGRVTARAFPAPGAAEGP